MVLFLRESKHTSLLVVTVLLLIEICFISADRQLPKGNMLKQRKKRQSADIILMGYKARTALKSTTRHPEYFRRVGKKWSRLSKPTLSDEDRIFLQQAGLGDATYLDSDDYAHRW